MGDIEEIEHYIQELMEDLNMSKSSIIFRINRSKNFFIPYCLREDGLRLRTLEQYANNLGYRLIYAYNLDKKYIDDLILFQYYLEEEKIIGPIDVKRLNEINIIKVGLDVLGVRRLDLFDK